MLLFTFWHRSLIVKSEQGQYWRNEPRNLAGSWRCGFLLTCEFFGLASCVYYTLVTDAAAGRLLWDILFGWSLSIHVHGCTISLVYNIFCWIFCLGHLQRWKSLLDTKVFSFFFVYILRTFASVIFNIFDLRGNTRLLGYLLYIHLFIYFTNGVTTADGGYWKEACVNCFIRDFCDSSVCFFSLWIMWGYWSVHFQIYLSVRRGVHSYDCAASPRTDIEQWCHHLTWKFDRRIMVSHIFPFLFSLPLLKCKYIII